MSNVFRPTSSSGRYPEKFGTGGRGEQHLARHIEQRDDIGGVLDLGFQLVHGTLHFFLGFRLDRQRGRYRLAWLYLNNPHSGQEVLRRREDGPHPPTLPRFRRDKAPSTEDQN